MELTNQIRRRWTEDGPNGLDTFPIALTGLPTDDQGAPTIDPIGKFGEFAVHKSIVDATGDTQGNHLGSDDRCRGGNLFAWQVGAQENRLPALIPDRKGYRQGA
jgi:hypothetical protein